MIRRCRKKKKERIHEEIYKTLAIDQGLLKVKGPADYEQLDVILTMNQHSAFIYESLNTAEKLSYESTIAC